MRTPKFIYFDLGNVLLNFDHQLAAQQVAELCGRTPQDVWNLLFGSTLQNDYESGRLTTAQLAEIVQAKLGGSIAPDAFARAISDIFWINHSILPVICQLRSAGWPLGILSNTCDAHWEWIIAGRYPFLLRSFHHRVLSYVVGAMKPERAIYEVAAEQAGVAPADILFFDDRPENVAGAHAAGWDAVLYRDTAQVVVDLLARGVVCNL